MEKRRFNWARFFKVWLPLVALVFLLAFLFPPPLTHIRMDQSWRPDCPQIDASWLALDPPEERDWEWRTALGTSMVIGADLDPRGGFELVLPPLSGLPRRSRLFEGLSFIDATETEDGIVVLAMSAHGVPTLITLDPATLEDRRRLPLPSRLEDGHAIRRLVQLADGTLAVLAESTERDGWQVVRLDRATGKPGWVFQLPRPFDPLSDIEMLTRLIEIAEMPAVLPLDAEEMLDPDTGYTLYLTSPWLREFEIDPAANYVRRTPAQPGFGPHNRMAILKKPNVALRGEFSIPWHGQSLGDFSQLRGHERVIGLRSFLWHTIDDQWKPFPFFEQWTNSVDDLVLVLPSENRYETDVALPVSVVEPARWTAQAMYASGLTLREYAEDRALVTHAVYPTPSKVNRGNGLIRLGVLAEPFQTIEWFGWVPLPSGFATAPLANRLNVGVAGDRLWLDLRSRHAFAEQGNERPDRGWVMALPLPAALPVRDHGWLSEGEHQNSRVPTAMSAAQAASFFGQFTVPELRSEVEARASRAKETVAP